MASSAEGLNEQMLKEVNASVRKRLNSTNSNDFAINANTQDALSQIKSKFKGAICDSEGFYQHEGECWNDATQMIFLFSDGLKEIVQEKLANNEVDINFIPRDSIPKIIKLYNDMKEEKERLYAVNRNKYSRMIPPALTNEQIIESVVFYLVFLKHRFARHYIMESNRREEECKESHNPIKILHTKGKNAEMAAIFGNPSKNPHINLTIERYKADDKLKGATVSQHMYLINILVLIFFPPYQVETRSESSHLETYNMSIYTQQYIYATILNTDKHATCLYTCGGRDFFYEDNYGPFLFPWRDIFFKPDTPPSYITNVLFTKLKIDSQDIITTYYPIIKTKDNNYFTYYNGVLYNFPQYIFDSKPSEGFTEHSFDKLTFIFEYQDDRIINLSKLCMIPLFKHTLAGDLTISNTGFTFKRNSRINNAYKRKQRAANHGLAPNSPIADWEEYTSTDGQVCWYNPKMIKVVCINPYLIAQKTDEELRRELGYRNIKPPVNASHNVLVMALLEAPDISYERKDLIKRAANLGVPINSPILDWREVTGNDSRASYWYNPKINKGFTYINPYLTMQKPDDELRRDLRYRGISVANNASRDVLVNTLLHQYPLPQKPAAPLKRQFGSRNLFSAHPYIAPTQPSVEPTRHHYSGNDEPEASGGRRPRSTRRKRKGARTRRVR